MAVVEADVIGTELERVVPRVTVLFERDDMFFSSVEKRPVEKISNRLMRVPLEITPGGNFGYFDPNGGDLGRGSGPTWDKATLNSVFIREACEYTKLTEWATNDDRKAVINAVRRLTLEIMDELRRQIDSQLMQDGTGVVGEVSAVDVTGIIVTLTADFGARLVRNKQNVRVYDVNLTTYRGTGQITYWDVENSIVHIEPAVPGLQTGDFLVTDGIETPTALPALYGVPYQHSNSAVGTWLGFDRATTPEIRSNRVDAGNNALSLPLPRLAINKIGNRVGIKNDFSPDAWMHPCQKQAYEEIGQLVSMIFKKPAEESLNMYFDGMQMAGAPVKTSFNWNKTRIDFVAKTIWGRGEILPLGFYKTDGRSIFEVRGASGGVATADLFYMVWGAQFFVNNPAATAYIDDLAIPSGYN